MKIKTDTDLGRALWANKILGLCLLESDGDVSAALSAAEYILSNTKPEEEIDSSLLYGQPEVGGIGSSTVDTAEPKTDKTNKRTKKPQAKLKNCKKDKNKNKKPLKRLIGKKKWTSFKPPTAS